MSIGKTMIPCQSVQVPIRLSDIKTEILRKMPSSNCADIGEPPQLDYRITDYNVLQVREADTLDAPCNAHDGRQFATMIENGTRSDHAFVLRLRDLGGRSPVQKAKAYMAEHAPDCGFSKSAAEDNPCCLAQQVGLREVLRMRGTLPSDLIGQARLRNRYPCAFERRQRSLYVRSHRAD
jgi:hypothetical protein